MTVFKVSVFLQLLSIFTKFKFPFSTDVWWSIYICKQNGEKLLKVLIIYEQGLSTDRLHCGVIM